MPESLRDAAGRETWTDIEAAGFSDVDLRWYSTRGLQTIFRHYITGRAVTPGAAAATIAGTGVTTV